jgi:hypothetical protein
MNGYRLKTQILLVLGCFIFQFCEAQRDTSGNQVVTIVSAYKPVVKKVAKINVSASNLLPDSNKNLLPYNVPVQNLMYMYQPIVIKPLAVNNTEMVSLGSRYFVKAGFGNYTTPSLKAMALFGDGITHLIQADASYTSSKGKITHQNFSNLKFGANGSYYTTSHEIYSGLNFNSSQYYLYGYNHDSFKYDKKDISRLYQNMSFSAGIKNKIPNGLGINYDPNISVDLFTAKSMLSEFTFKANLPFEKKINDNITAQLNAWADLTSFKSKIPNSDSIKFNNNILGISPNIKYTSKIVQVSGGFNVIANNGKILFQPNVYGEMPLKKQKILLQAGWVGHVQKNTFKNLSAQNPYLNNIDKQINTTETEIYGGIKSNIGKYVVFSAKAGFVHYRDFQFYMNDTSSIENYKSFVLSQEPNLNNFRLHGDLCYHLRNRVQINAGMTINGYTGMKRNQKAWNTLPAEFNASAQWNITERFQVNSSFYFFSSGSYLDSTKKAQTFTGATDLSASSRYKINQRFTAFLDINNIFGQKYERWHNYQVYGINALVGVIFRY